jgi:hypothetical protein
VGRRCSFAPFTGHTESIEVTAQRVQWDGVFFSPVHGAHDNATPVAA